MGVVGLNFKNLANTKIVNTITGLNSKDLVYVSGTAASVAQKASAKSNKESNALSIVAIVISMLVLIAMIYGRVVGNRDPARVQDSTAAQKKIKTLEKELDLEDPEVTITSDSPKVASEAKSLASML